MSVINFAMLFGLAAVVIPPIIHLLNRRRFEVVDWGAMQFLQVSEVTRRRLLIEEILLMALRMGLIALLVVAMAEPFTEQQVLPVGDRVNRDVVVIVVGSASMGFEGGNGVSAKAWIEKFLDELTPGDAVALLIARQQPVAIVPKLSQDLDRVREKLTKLPAPAGSCDMAKSVQAAYTILDAAARGRREIVVISDGQRHGWADTRTLLGWEDLASKRNNVTENKPNLWVVNIDPQRPKKPANWSLAPLTTGRAVVAAGQDVTFRTAILLSGVPKYEPPYAVHVLVDEKPVMKLDPPKEASLESGQVPLRFEVKLPRVGSHLVSVLLEPDPPTKDRPSGYVVKDHLPVDNRRDFAVDVVEALPVLIVDGEEKTDKSESSPRASDFLRDALSPGRDKTPVIKVRVLRMDEFNASSLRDEEVNGKPGENKPRVLILSNVPRLSAPQLAAVETFVYEGGGLLVAAGDRVDADWYNTNAFRDGKGWVPARFDKVQGDGIDIKQAARPVRDSFVHPSLEMFRRPGISGLDSAYFTRWWRLVPPLDDEAGTVIAKIDREDGPFLVEGRSGQGRSILCSVPLDASWRSNLVDLLGYVPLLHEMVYYLASTRAAEHNLEPGQPLKYRMSSNAGQVDLKLKAPSDPDPGKPLEVDAEEDDRTYTARVVPQAQGPLLIHEGLTESGIWKLTTGDKQTVYYVVQPDPREGDLTPFNDDDKTKAAKHLPFVYEDVPGNLVRTFAEDAGRQFFWWIFLCGVVLLLCGEVWFTRKIVKGRA